MILFLFHNETLFIVYLIKMVENCCLNFEKTSQDPREATKFISEVLFKKIYPLMLEIRNKLHAFREDMHSDEIMKIHDVFSLCSSQIKKCLLTLFDVFKMEYHHQIFLQESRQYTFERLSWCVNRLRIVEEKLNISNKDSINSSSCSNDSILATPMYFVNWIDHTFEILSKLSNVVYKTDYKDTSELYDQWKNEVVDCVTTLHISLDELLLSAMTLCKYCLPADQHVVKARCQVVLRETKALLNELVEGDIDAAFKVIPESLKLPIMPSNINVLIDVLKDVLYVLETNTNTALLALLVHCFSTSVPPVDVLKDHFAKSNGTCACHLKTDGDTEDCSFVKEFDLYNERLMQIGSFAVSCSSDQSRILSLRSGLASLEALDPHLVPALMLSPESQHAALLMNSWCQEVQDVRDSVFLIVDPAAFAEKAKQMMHQTLLDIMTEAVYCNKNVCFVINIGSVVHNFFTVYNKLEPDALTHHEQLVPLLNDLDKVQVECKIVSNLLSSKEDFMYDIKKTANTKQPSMEQLLKRLKLLYTLVGKINSLLHPKENDDQSFEGEGEEIKKHVTHTIYAKNAITYVNSPKKAQNISRSIFARTANIRSSTTNLPLSKLKKHLKAKKGDELSFSVQLDEFFNLSEVKLSTGNTFVNKTIQSLREPSNLYNYSPRKRSSLRKAVLNKYCQLSSDNALEGPNVSGSSASSEKGSLMDDATSLQITDILNQMNDLTKEFSTKNFVGKSSKNMQVNEEGNTTLRISINDANAAVSKCFWNIPVNANSVGMHLDDSEATMSSNVTTTSNVTTLERINDIDLVESRLNSLKSLAETSL